MSCLFKTVLTKGEPCQTHENSHWRKTFLMFCVPQVIFIQDSPDCKQKRSFEIKAILMQCVFKIFLMERKPYKTHENPFKD